MRTVFMTGASGLLGRAVTTRAGSMGELSILPLGRLSTDAQWQQTLASSDAGLHLAGVTRPQHPDEFWSGNVGTTRTLVSAVQRLGRPLPLLYASSIRALEPTLYGRTKKAAEDLLLELACDAGLPVTILRLPSFFGRWSKPGYNSAVATFCHEVAEGRLPAVMTPDAPISLVHLDDVVGAITAWMKTPASESGLRDVHPTYSSTVGRVAAIIAAFGAGTDPQASEAEAGLAWGLWQTYQSHRHSLADRPLLIPAEKKA
jgi:UDP-2-acetamido-2,6-beta-L-arabino-hexul-4-ose reductase